MSGDAATKDPRAEGFREPDYSAAVDFRAQIAALDPAATVKGMFFGELVEAIKSQAAPKLEELSLTERRYLPFSDYSQRDYLVLLEQTVDVVYPNLPSAEGVRRIGWSAFPRFVESVIGRVVVGIFVDDLDRLLASMAKAMRYCISPGFVEAEQIGERHWRYQMRDMPGATRVLLAGATEGVLKYHGLVPTVLVRDIGSGNFDFSIQWTEAE